MGRILEPSNYGVLAAIISLVGLLALISSSAGMVVAKMVAGAKDENEIDEQIETYNKYGWLLGVIFFLVLLLLSPLIAQFLKVQVFLVVIGLFVFLLSFPASMVRSTLQGLMKFKNMVISQALENLVRLAGGVVLVIVGFSVTGGLLGLLLGVFVGWVVARQFIKNSFLKPKNSSSAITFTSMLKSLTPFLLLSISITSLYSSDLILVKHFYNSFDSGIYAAFSFLGRIIFFGVSPITAVMFPIVARNHSMGASNGLVLKMSLLGGLIVALIVNFIYGFFPNFVIGQLYGDKYLVSSNLLIFFGIFMTLVTFSFLLLNYAMIINRYRAVWVSMCMAVLQIILILFFHSTMFTIVIISIIVSSLLLIYLFSDLFFSRSRIS